MQIRELTFQDRLYIKHIPDDLTGKDILIVGAGTCRIDYHLNKMGYRVYSTDYDDRTTNKNTGYEKMYDDWCNEYHKKGLVDYYDSCTIFDLDSFPIKKANLVMCTQTLEHLKDYKLAFQNLLELASEFVIISVPHEKSFNHPAPPPAGHCNFWSDNPNKKNFKEIQEFVNLAKPYKVTFSKGLTKLKDYYNPTYPRALIITIDKRSKESSDVKIKDFTQEQLNWK